MWQTEPKPLGAVVMDVTGVRASQSHDTLNQIFSTTKVAGDAGVNAHRDGESRGRLKCDLPGPRL
ncbi:hypothetical protein SAMN04488502_1011121 [Dendrosporobacter quercicolus]|uniref:Uncharacterized protein n=1 Tax=Dendrosporobacter quercicolus TaxID=146817 RepID=A0A1G9NTR0_9FIRM|nr:hypothetical protein SAMN04488502_1011121 [Dendrosporobacter quercicolus]